MNAGRNTTTHKNENTMPLHSVIPRSAPIRNCMKPSAAKPNSVVAAEAAMAEKLCLMAVRIARTGSGSPSRARWNACSRKMA